VRLVNKVMNDVGHIEMSYIQAAGFSSLFYVVQISKFGIIIILYLL